MRWRIWYMQYEMTRLGDNKIKIIYLIISFLLFLALTIFLFFTLLSFGLFINILLLFDLGTVLFGNLGSTVRTVSAILGLLLFSQVDVIFGRSFGSLDLLSGRGSGSSVSLMVEFIYLFEMVSGQKNSRWTMMS